MNSPRVGALLAVACLAAAPLASAQHVSNFYFSVDIGGDWSFSDPIKVGNGPEVLDPGDIFYSDPTGLSTQKDDLALFGFDPQPLPPLPIPSAPIPPERDSAFDLDGEDQLPLDLLFIDPPHMMGPTNGLFLNPHILYYSLDDDDALGWWNNSVPVMSGPDRGGAKDELLFVTNWPGFQSGVPGSPHLGEADLGLGSNPMPPEFDDDVDALDLHNERYWYFSADHEARANLDPGDIYRIDRAAPGGPPVKVVDNAQLGMPDGVDIDAFEFLLSDDATVIAALGGLQGPGTYLMVIFSVDTDDLDTPTDESGMVNPAAIYISAMNGTFVLLSVREDDVDALTLNGIEEEPPVDAKWYQPPDLSTDGMDVDATEPSILADDFLCTTNGALTNIVVYGSWLHDLLPPGGPADCTFTLSIHADIPVGPLPWSTPGELLWLKTFAAGQYPLPEIEADQIAEGWLDPPTTNYIPGVAPGPADTVCWKYTFPIDPADAFVQTGTVVNPIIYWLDVQAMPNDPTGEARFGWKSSTTNWNDDAVWGQGLEPYPGPWTDLHYPPGHERHPESMDLAFEIYGDGKRPETPEFDWGDAPDPTYPTLSINTGASHWVAANALPRFGQYVDTEFDGQPAPPGTGDDLTGVPDDEDGINVSAIKPGAQSSWLTVAYDTAGGGATIQGWVDFNVDGVWTPDERVASNLTFISGVAFPISFAVPAYAPPGLTTYARFRISSQTDLPPDGAAPDGEVEDYEITIREPDIDFGDAPDATVGTGKNYPTRLVDDGARHIRVTAPAPGLTLASIDMEANGQPEAQALGDDNNGADDEDGIILPPFLQLGVTASVTANVQNAAGYLNAWVDLNADGDWGDAGEQVITDAAVSPGANGVSFPVPATAALGSTFARFRLDSAGGVSMLGLALDGEVEDYEIEIRKKFPPDLGPKWIQPPDCSNGINIASWRFKDRESSPYGYVVADDWECDGRPINAIRWWGSYIQYMGPVAAPDTPQGGVRPAGFRIRWFTDMPAAQNPDGYSRPVYELTNTFVQLLPPRSAITNTQQTAEKFICSTPLDAWGFSGQYEHKYQYTAVLEEPWNEKPGDVYWLSIEAVYTNSFTPPADNTLMWGWETIDPLYNWNDDAVIASNLITGHTAWQEMVYPPPVPPWDSGPYDGESINMAFALYSTVTPRRAYKWRQPPDMLTGVDMPSWSWVTVPAAPPPYVTNSIRADDFISDGRRITDIHWWGSYPWWQWNRDGSQTNQVPPPAGLPTRPHGFNLSWHTNATCLPSTALTNLFVNLDDCHETYYGTVRQNWLDILVEAPVFEHEYQYYVDLLDPRINAPWYEQTNGHYWINIEAVFDDFFVPLRYPQQGSYTNHMGWGWKITADEVTNCPSVVTDTYPIPQPWTVSKLPVLHPREGDTHDLAFELTTDEVATSVWHQTPEIVWITHDTSGTSLIGSVGDLGAGTQHLYQSHIALASNIWSSVLQKPVPYPPPATNWWMYSNATNTFEFYRIISK